VRAVLAADGKPLERYQLKIDRAADPAAVQSLNASLTQVMRRGTGRGSRALLPEGLVIAGKTGTSDDTRDSWFAGFTNDHVTVVWVGADDNSETGFTGATGALPVWARLVAGLGDASYETLPADGLRDMSFDYYTGMMAAYGCGDPVNLPLPTNTVLPANTRCAGGGDDLLENLADGAMQWLKEVLN
jgi:penicillin-binding protein 1B